jgi:hypothetical protein
MAMKIKHVPCSTVTERWPFEYVIELDSNKRWREMHDWLVENHIPCKMRSLYQIYMNEQDAVLFALKWS